MAVTVTTNAFKEAAVFGNAALQAPQDIAAVVRSYGNILRALVRRNASRRPGPLVRTGRHLNSIKLEYRRISPTESTSEVFSDNPYAAILEMGGVTVDSDGNETTHKAYPHFGPAASEIREEFISNVTKASVRAISKR